ncbi:ABC-2 family transporter protein [Candidatus Falkowbacteria bacterium]|nr:ABC-2 family transporter protein [Candidatus Falkowbacteria bacterium]
MFKKYWHIFKNSFQAGLVYRFNVFTSFFTAALSLVIFIYLWFSIYNQGGRLGDYNLRELIIYYIVSSFIALIIKAKDIGWVIGDEIRLGGISSYLVRPISFLYKSFFDNLGQAALMAAIFGVAVFAPLLFLQNFFSLFTGVLFAASVFLAVCLNFLIFYLVGISTFYFGFVMGFNFIMINIASFLSGGFIPLDLLPKWLFIISAWLPFKYLIFYPISIAMGKVNGYEALSGLGAGVLWMMILFLAAKILFKRGLKKYEGFGL